MSLSAEAFAAIADAFDAPADVPRGLPAAAYADAGVFRAEQAGLFRRRWVAIGYADDVPEPGDVKPVEAPSGTPLLLVRGKDGALRVFLNACRHRGMPLVVEEGRRGAIVCPYHAWSYALDGRLIRAPHFHGFQQHGGAEVAALVGGLTPVRHAVWHRIVFVNLSGDAEPFEEFIGPLDASWSWLDLSDLRHGASFRYEVQANWKLVCENFVDIYHIPYVHPSLNKYNAKMRDNAPIDCSPDCVGTRSDTYTPTDAAAGRLPKFPGACPDGTGFIESLSLFPNLLLTLFDDNLRSIIVHPLGPDASVERVEIYFRAATLDAAHDEARRITAERFPAFNHEDIGVCEGLQRNMAAGVFDGGYFSPRYDETVTRFQRRYCWAMTEARSAGGVNAPPRRD